MAKTYRRILIFIVILGVLMGLLGKKFAGDQYVNTEPRKNTECTLTKRVFDDADVLTDEEEKNLEALIAEKEELIGGDLVLITTNDASLDTMGNFVIMHRIIIKRISLAGISLSEAEQFM